MKYMQDEYEYEEMLDDENFLLEMEQNQTLNTKIFDSLETQNTFTNYILNTKKVFYNETNEVPFNTDDVLEYISACTNYIKKKVDKDITTKN